MIKNIMKNIKAKPLLRTIILLAILVSVITTVTLSVTNAWYAGMFSIDANGMITMGEVAIKWTNPADGGPTVPDIGDENNAKITNDSTIPIILRVRVIPEWVQTDTTTPDPTGVPPTKSEVAVTITGTGDWLFNRQTLNPSFLVYTGGTDKIGTDYGIRMPEDGNQINVTYTVGVVPSTLAATFDPIAKIYKRAGETTGWELKITLIAEALQATQKAYNYTVNTSGATSWLLN